MGLPKKGTLARRLLGLGKPKSDSAMATAERYVGKESDWEPDKSRGVVTTRCPDVTSFTEIKACKQILGLLRIPKVPRHVIAGKTIEGMHKVITKLEDAGETRDFIVKFYWDIPEFRELWQKLGYDEAKWRAVVGI